jgi:hypothetical protein
MLITILTNALSISLGMILGLFGLAIVSTAIAFAIQKLTKPDEEHAELSLALTEREEKLLRLYLCYVFNDSFYLKTMTDKEKEWFFFGLLQDSLGTKDLPEAHTMMIIREELNTLNMEHD